jgi:hypothetical protein
MLPLLVGTNPEPEEEPVSNDMEDAIDVSFSDPSDELEVQGEGSEEASETTERDRSTAA